MNKANILKVENLSEVLGLRGSVGSIGKWLMWIEELSAASESFRSVMDNMKTAITDDDIASRPMYGEVQHARNTNEYIAASNPLVGILEDIMTVHSVSSIKQKDDVWFGGLRRLLTPDVIDNLAAYLSDYTTQLPLKSMKTQILKTMTENSREPIEEYVQSIKCTAGNDFGHVTTEPEFIWAHTSDMYVHFRQWCVDQGERLISCNKFKAKLVYYDSSIVEKRCRLDGDHTWVMVFPTDDFVDSDDVDDVELSNKVFP